MTNSLRSKAMVTFKERSNVLPMTSLVRSFKYTNLMDIPNASHVEDSGSISNHVEEYYSKYIANC